MSARGQTADKVRAFKLGAEDYLVKPFDSAELVARVEKALARRDLELGASPTTRLPGSQAIEAEIDRRLASGGDFAFCYLDLDNLKAFNDYYGYAKADGVILQTGDIVREVVARVGGPGDFIGHIAGDDFVFITTARARRPGLPTVIETFDRLVPLYYNKIDRERGFIETNDRYGVLRRFPIMSVSIACATRARPQHRQPQRPVAGGGRAQAARQGDPGLGLRPRRQRHLPAARRAQSRLALCYIRRRFAHDAPRPQGRDCCSIAAARPAARTAGFALIARNQRALEIGRPRHPRPNRAARRRRRRRRCRRARAAAGADGGDDRLGHALAAELEGALEIVKRQTRAPRRAPFSSRRHDGKVQIDAPLERARKEGIGAVVYSAPYIEPGDGEPMLSAATAVRGGVLALAIPLGELARAASTKCATRSRSRSSSSTPPGSRSRAPAVRRTRCRSIPISSPTPSPRATDTRAASPTAASSAPSRPSVGSAGRWSPRSRRPKRSPSRARCARRRSPAPPPPPCSRSSSRSRSRAA